MNTIDAGPGRQRTLKFDPEPLSTQRPSDLDADPEVVNRPAVAIDQARKTIAPPTGLARSVEKPDAKAILREPPATASEVERAHPNIERTIDKEKEREDAMAALARDALRRRYLIVENKYYMRAEARRDSKEALAFVDKGRRLATSHDDPDIARSMVLLAEAKSWASIKVKGSATFRREVWLEASVRGIGVEGYKANDLDKARLEDLRATKAARSENEIVEGPSRKREPGRDAEYHDRTKTSREPPARDPHQLTPKQETAVETVRQVLRARGDSEQAIAMAVEVARERFLNDRVYAGKIIETGYAPYLHNKENDDNYFIKLATKYGERTVWGEELRSALHNAKAAPGDAVAIACLGKKNVTVETAKRDDKGNRTEKVVSKSTIRNDWAVMPLEELRVEARERLMRSAELSEKIERKAPVINVYDSKAPKSTDRDLELDQTSPKPRPRERHLPR